MAKAVLISIRPEWAAKIATGEKTVEIRKTRPNLGTPFKCYIYETQGKSDTPWIDEDGHMIFRGCGKVVGEFICDQITWLTHIGFTGGHDIHIAAMKDRYMVDYAFDLSGSCLTIAQIEKYLDGEDGYAWHISKLEIYDTPKSLSKFTGLRKTKFGAEPMEIKRTPQSWCYVEGFGNG